jgi:hypothetical protein
MMATSSCCQGRNERQGEVQIWQKKRSMQGESRERDSVSAETFAVYPCSGDVPRAQQLWEWMGLASEVF